MKAAFLGVGLVLATVGALAVVGHADQGEDERVEELMEKTHEGKKSPYRKLSEQAEAKAPSWEVVGAHLPQFDAMSRALLESKNGDIKGSADGYVDAVKEITAAAKSRDAKAFRGAFQALSRSCGDCHFKGGVGGELHH